MLDFDTCEDVTITTEGSELECTLPAGTGANIAIYLVLTVGGAQVESDSSVSQLGYAPPSIQTLYVDPSVCDATDDLQLENCPNEESDPATVLTLTGSDFGDAGAVVLVGGRPCLSLTHSVAHTGLECNLPGGHNHDNHDNNNNNNNNTNNNKNNNKNNDTTTITNDNNNNNTGNNNSDENNTTNNNNKNNNNNKKGSQTKKEK